jgi:hypothetical protein
MSTTIAEKFQSPEYTAFKDVVMRSVSDNALRIRNNTVIYGKTKVPVPPFVTLDTLNNELGKRKTLLFMQYSDLYDKIITSSNPAVYRKDYDNVVNDIASIDATMEEVMEYLEQENERIIQVPLNAIQEKVTMNQSRMDVLVQEIKNDIRVDRKKIKEVLQLHKENATYGQQYVEAVSVFEKDYVILSLDSSSSQSHSTEPKSLHGGKGKKKDIERNARIKQQAKKFMSKKLM